MKKIIILFLLCGCANLKFKKAYDLEKRNKFKEAIKIYKEIVDKYPTKKISARAIFRLGEIYRVNFEDYEKASHFYSMIIMDYPYLQPLNSLAELGLMESPDFFPLVDGWSWYEGDSQSYGKNMYQQRYCSLVSSGTDKLKRYFEVYKIRTIIYTGKGGKKVFDSIDYYKKFHYNILKSKTPTFSKFSIVMKFPHKKGKKWTAVLEGKKNIYSIEDLNAQVVVRTGSYKNCLKIKELQPNIPHSWRYDYYAPGVGKVLSTVATERTEKRNSELIDFSWKTIKKRF